ncbi:MAG: glutaredoxin family protein [Paracoccaceae bacterium]
MRLLHLAGLLLLLLGVLRPGLAQEVTAHVFWQEGCPYCQGAKTALNRLQRTDPELRIDLLELGPSDEVNALFRAAARALGIRTPAVPLVVIGSAHELGFSQSSSPERYAEMIARCRAAPCRDLVAELRADRAPPEPVGGAAAPDSVTLPLLGEVGLRGLSLPVLTVVLGGVDGFNPCAMWVLALLIGLLLGVQDSRRMWVLGLVFLGATGAMYFAVMAAWLNVVLWLGAVTWLRLAIGALAIGAGGYYLREFWTNPEGVCRITPGGQRRRIRDAFSRMVAQPSLPVAALGVAALAVAVNLVELVCSAGVPAVYTQILSMHDLPKAAYYGYLALYLAVFLLDDAAIFVIAMLTLRAVAATGRYARVSHLIGGVVLLALGAVMVLRPDLLG